MHIAVSASSSFLNNNKLVMQCNHTNGRMFVRACIASQKVVLCPKGLWSLVLALHWGGCRIYQHLLVWCSDKVRISYCNFYASCDRVLSLMIVRLYSGNPLISILLIPSSCSIQQLRLDKKVGQTYILVKYYDIQFC